MPPIRDGKQQLAVLELLRVIASLMIVLFHAHSIALKHAMAEGSAFFAAPPWWYSCIDLFFTMSGFLMIYMGRALYGSTRGVQIFAIRRLCRTPPLYWIFTLLITLIFLIRPSLSAEGPIDLHTFLSSVLFFPTVRHPVIAIGWTLNYEIFFYCIIGLSMLLPYDKGWKCAAFILVALVTLGRVLNVQSEPWYVWTDPLLLDFAIGILVAVAYFRGWTLGFFGSVVLGIAGLGLIASYTTLQDLDLKRIATMGAGWGCIIAATTWRVRPLTFGALQPFIARLSQQTYTMYLCHILVLKVLEIAFFRLFHGFWQNIGFILLGTLLTLAASKVLYELIERPLSELLRERAKLMTLALAPRPV